MIDCGYEDTTEHYNKIRLFWFVIFNLETVHNKPRRAPKMWAGQIEKNYHIL